ncbi:hypothetical protein WAI453_013714 [Rhynchosporium graminicola]
MRIIILRLLVITTILTFALTLFALIDCLNRCGRVTFSSSTTTTAAAATNDFLASALFNASVLLLSLYAYDARLSNTARTVYREIGSHYHDYPYNPLPALPSARVTFCALPRHHAQCALQSRFEDIQSTIFRIRSNILDAAATHADDIRDLNRKIAPYATFPPPPPPPPPPPLPASAASKLARARAWWRNRSHRHGLRQIFQAYHVLLTRDIARQQTLDTDLSRVLHDIMDVGVEMQRLIEESEDAGIPEFTEVMRSKIWAHRTFFGRLAMTSSGTTNAHVDDDNTHSSNPIQPLQLHLFPTTTPHILRLFANPDPKFVVDTSQILLSKPIPPEAWTVWGENTRDNWARVREIKGLVEGLLKETKAVQGLVAQVRGVLEGG